MRSRFIGPKLVAMAVLAGALSTPAWATLEIDFGGTNSGGTITGGTTCVDNTACDTNPAVGTIETTMVPTQFSVLGTVSVSTSPVGALSFTLNGVPTSTGTMNFAVTDNNFTTPPTPLVLGENISGLSSPPVGGTGVAASISSTGFFSSTNADFTTSGGSSGLASTVLNAGPTTSTSPTLTGTSPYSLTEFITVNITALATTTDKSLQVSSNIATTAVSTVPEPKSVLLLSSALLLVGLLKRKREG